MLCEIFYYTVFTRYWTGKIWSSICIQDIAKRGLHYQVNLIRVINIITHFLYQISLTDKFGENIYLYV